MLAGGVLVNLLLMKNWKCLAGVARGLNLEIYSTYCTVPALVDFHRGRVSCRAPSEPPEPPQLQHMFPYCGMPQGKAEVVTDASIFG